MSGSAVAVLGSLAFIPAVSAAPYVTAGLTTTTCGYFCWNVNYNGVTSGWTRGTITIKAVLYEYSTKVATPPKVTCYSSTFCRTPVYSEFTEAPASWKVVVTACRGSTCHSAESRGLTIPVAP